MSYTHSNVVAVVLRNAEGEVLLFERKDTKRYPHTYCLPCGRVDPGDTLRFAAARETREEIGIEVDEHGLELLAIMDRPNWPNAEAPRVLETYFVAKSWVGTPVNKEPEKHHDPRWVALDDLPDNLHAYTRDALANLDKGNMMYKVYLQGEPL
ncbi:MAG: NUDIX domain-containing protein [Pseudomonadaceae bacterium]|nr:NUDIX domain-containing protein [Pseudomonadaceae bacterium]